MAADPDLLVDVRGVHPASAGSPVYEEYGSGLLVGADLVLTAAHVVFDGTEPLPVVLRIPHHDEPYEGEVVWPRPRGDLDIALVRLRRSVFPVVRASRLVRFARFTGRSGGQPVDAAGFPEVMFERGVRVAYQLRGHVNPQGARYQGRYLVAVDDPPNDKGRATSPWAGMSGAALMSSGAVVGVIVIDSPGFGSRQLTAVPAVGLAADPTARQLLGLAPHLPSVELDPVLNRPVVSDRELSPAQMLRADEEVVPFQGRDDELTELTAWCQDEREFGARLVVGPGGRGKTRLAQLLTSEIQRRDGAWLSGLLSTSSAVAENVPAIMSTARVHPVLLVIDYAESRWRQIDYLLDVYQWSDNPPRLRLLMLARDRGEWWNALSDRHPDLIEPDSYLALPPLHPLFADRIGAFRLSVDTFARRLDVAEPAHDWLGLANRVQPGRLDDERFGDPLSLQLKALLALLEVGNAGSRGSLENRLLAHERDYWRTTLDAEGLRLSATARDQAVAAATLMAVRDRAGAVALLQQIPELEDHRRVADWLRSLYPTESSARYWGPLQPDRLGEHHVGSVTSADPTLLGHLLSGDNVEQLQEALVVVGRAMAHQTHLESQLQVLVRSGRPALVEAIGRAAGQVADPLPLQRLVPDGMGLWRATIDPDDYGSSSSWGHGASVPDRIIEIGRGIGGNPFTSYGSGMSRPPAPIFDEAAPDLASETARGREHERLATSAYEAGNLVLAGQEFERAAEAFGLSEIDSAHFARVLLTWASVLSDQREHAQAMHLADQAVSLIRARVADGQLEADVLGRALDLEAGISGELGDVERAVSLQYEAEALLRQHAAAHPTAAVLRDLARALSNLAGLMQRSGRARDALKASDEAIALFDRAREREPAGWTNANQGRALLGHARIVATATGPEAALPVLRRAVDVLESVARAVPSGAGGLAPDLAAAHEVAAGLLGEIGQLEQAAWHADVALGQYQSLSELRPAFSVDLARTLTTTAELRLQLGQAPAALALAQRAVDLLDDLERRPVAEAASGRRRRTRETAHARALLAEATDAVWGRGQPS